MHHFHRNNPNRNGINVTTSTRPAFVFSPTARASDAVYPRATEAGAW